MSTDQPPGGPLAGTVVVGLEQSVAGPLATRILADLGAQVWKVEPPGGDFARSWDRHAAGESAQFWWLNRRKRSIVLDLAAPRDRRRLHALLGGADVLVHNASPAAADRLGLGPELLERFPHLVNCQISGYGAATSQRDRKAYDLLVQAESGLMSLTGTTERPAKAGVSVADVSTGVYAALLVLAALIERATTGRGRHLDVAMLDATVEFLGPMLVSHLGDGVVYPRSLDRHHAIAPYGVYRCGDGRPLLLACLQDAEWVRLAEGLLGDPSLGADPRFATNPDRIRHRETVDRLVGEGLARLPFDAATGLLDRLGLGWAEVRDVEGVVTHPALLERGAFDAVENAEGVPVRTLVGLPERVFGLPRTGRLRPPQPGEDSDLAPG